MSSFTTNPFHLSLPGPRVYLDTPEKINVIMNQITATLITANQTLPTLTSLSIGDKSYNASTSTLLSSLLLSNTPNLTHLDISDCIAGRPEADALLILEAFSDVASKTIKCLEHLECNDNAMGLKGIAVTRTLIDAHRSTLKSLSMCNDGLSHESMELIASIVKGDETLQTLSLEKLHFFNNMSGDLGCTHLSTIITSLSALITPTSTYQGLKDLRFSGTRASRVGSNVLASSFSLNIAALSNIVHLDLCDNTFTDAIAGDNLAIALKSGMCKCLKTLNLRDCALKDGNAVKVINGIVEGYGKGSSCLVKLDLSGNELTFKSMKPLSALLNIIKTVEFLALEENELGSKGVHTLLASIKNGLNNVKDLRLASSEISERGGEAILKFVSALKSLSILALDGNVFSESLVENFEELGICGEFEENEEDGEEEWESDADEEEEVEEEAEEQAVQVEEEELDIVFDAISLEPKVEVAVEVLEEDTGGGEPTIYEADEAAGEEELSADMMGLMIQGVAISKP